MHGAYFKIFINQRNKTQRDRRYKCKKDPSNSFDGLYSLDYLLTFRDDNKDIVQVNSLEESLARISTILKAKAPMLLESFEDFVIHIRNTDDYSKKRIWEKA